MKREEWKSRRSILIFPNYLTTFESLRVCFCTVWKDNPGRQENKLEMQGEEDTS